MGSGRTYAVGGFALKLPPAFEAPAWLHVASREKTHYLTEQSEHADERSAL